MNETLALERLIADELDTSDVAAIIGPLEQGEIILLARFLAARLAAATPPPALDMPRCVIDHDHGRDEGHCVYEDDAEYAARLTAAAPQESRERLREALGRAEHFAEMAYVRAAGYKAAGIAERIDECINAIQEARAALADTGGAEPGVSHDAAVESGGQTVAPGSAAPQESRESPTRIRERQDIEDARRLADTGSAEYERQTIREWLHGTPDADTGSAE